MHQLGIAVSSEEAGEVATGEAAAGRAAEGDAVAGVAAGDAVAGEVVAGTGGGGGGGGIKEPRSRLNGFRCSNILISERAHWTAARRGRLVGLIGYRECQAHDRLAIAAL